MRVILLGILTLAIVACEPTVEPQRASPSPAGPSPIPWIAATAVATPQPAPTRRPRPTGIASCAASDLAAAFLGGQGAGGWITRTFVIGNRSASRCIIDGPVRAAYLDAGGAEIVADAVEGQQGTSISQRWAVLEPRTAPITDAPPRDGQADLTLATYGDCGTAPAFHEVALTFAAPTGTLRIPMLPGRVGGRCDGPDLRLTLGIAVPLEAFPSETLAPPRLQASIEVPAQIRAGESLRYVVRLRNVSAETYVWEDGCPLYEELLNGHPVDPTDRPARFTTAPPGKYAGSAAEIHPLNCVAAGPIPAGASIAFEMRIDVPADDVGQQGLLWWMVGPPSLMPSASISVDVLSVR
ncbi:MAG TPA: hypothetical protein VKE23_05000 [Candidatus Limnocylindria bacterium]|nr:hypothetical protein [Candidatus Limnocylindria bacterium]